MMIETYTDYLMVKAIILTLVWFFYCFQDEDTGLSFINCHLTNEETRERSPCQKWPFSTQAGENLNIRNLGVQGALFLRIP